MRGTGVSLGPLSTRTPHLAHYLAAIPPTLLRRLLVRGTALWLLARLMGKAVLAAGAAGASAVLSPWVVIMTAGLTLVDLHRRRELALLHNLGVTTSTAVLAASLPALVLEAVLVMLVP